ncbi:MAG: hypothetical protein ACR2FO_03300 [Actinomycetota bacterium]
MKFTRHAKNRIRLIARADPGVTPEAVLFGVGSASVLRYDDKGNKVVLVVLEDRTVTAVVDVKTETIITIWANESS